jgi:PQQ-dependent catabolism-associated CXXCW motif protein
MPRRVTTWLLALIAVALSSLPTVANDDKESFDPVTGDRIAHYRAPVPNELAGAKVISSGDVDGLVKNQNAVLIDAMPAEGGGFDPATGQWRLIKIHSNIPGSVWLPDVGRGKPLPAITAFFSTELTRLTKGDKARALIIYCQSDCWMGWNATRRAIALGYTNVFWFPEGIDGWRDWDGKFTPAVPLPVTVSKSQP